MKLKYKNIIKQVKSTILGTVLIGVGIYMIVKLTDYNHYLAGGLIGAGVLLWFAPDKLINALEKLVLGQEIKITKGDKADSEELS